MAMSARPVVVGQKPSNVMYTQYAQQQQPPQQRPAANQGGIVVGGQEPLTSHMLAQAAPQARYFMIYAEYKAF